MSSAAFDHRLAGALAASLAAHAAAMTLAPPVLRVAPPEALPALQVELIEPPRISEPARPKIAPQPAPEVAAPEKPKSKQVAEKKQRPAPRPPEPLREEAPAVVEPAPPAEPVPLALEAPRLTAKPVPEQKVALPPPPPVAVLAPVPRVPSPELLSGYTQGISKMLAQHREYPRVALMRGWEGSVTMRLRVAPSGRLIDAELHTSSGYDVLDRQALAMVAEAGPLPAPPEGLRDGEIEVLVPVNFRLR